MIPNLKKFAGYNITGSKLLLCFCNFNQNLYLFECLDLPKRKPKWYFISYYELFLCEIQVCVLRMEINQTSGDESLSYTNSECSLDTGCFSLWILCIILRYYQSKNDYTIYDMVVYRSHDTAGGLAHQVCISRPTGQIYTLCQNPDPLARSRPTGKIQTHWFGHNVVYIVTHNIKKIKSCFHQCFIYMIFLTHFKIFTTTICMKVPGIWHKKTWKNLEFRTKPIQKT